MGRSEQWHPQQQVIFEAIYPYMEAYIESAVEQDHRGDVDLCHAVNMQALRIADIASAEGLHPPDQKTLQERARFIGSAIHIAYNYTSLVHGLALQPPDQVPFHELTETVKGIVNHPEYHRTFIESLWRLPSVSMPERYLLLQYLPVKNICLLDDGCASHTGPALWHTPIGRKLSRQLETQFSVLKKRKKETIVAVGNDIQPDDPLWTLASSEELGNPNRAVRESFAELQPSIRKTLRPTPQYARYTSDLFETMEQRRRLGWTRNNGAFTVQSHFFMRHLRPEKSLQDWLSLGEYFLCEGGYWIDLGFETKTGTAPHRTFQMHAYQKQNGEMVDAGVIAELGNDQKTVQWVNEDFFSTG